METVPAEEIRGRIEKFQKKIKEKGTDAAIVAQNVDLYYFTGSCQRGYLIVPAQGEPLYLVSKSYERALKESPLSNIRHLQSSRALPQILKETVPGFKKIGLELDVLPAFLYLRFQEMFSPAEIVDISTEIKDLRLIKSPYEIEIIRQGAEISRQMFAAVPRFLKEGKKEIEFAAEVECFMRKRGHQGAIHVRQFNQEVFYGHIMSGENLTRPSFFDSPTGGPGLSPAFPQGPGWKVISRDEVVIVDYVTAYLGYCVDCTRFYSLGDIPSLLQEAHQVALVIQEEIIKTAKPGAICSDIYKQACQMAEKLGFKDYFMGHGADQAKFIGHGVGLELDEMPVLANRQNYPLQEVVLLGTQMLSRRGVAGWENTILLRNKVKNNSHPEEIILFNHIP